MYLKIVAFSFLNGSDLYSIGECADMVSNQYLMVRVTKIQKERVKQEAEAKGFRTISDYIRSLALEHAPNFDIKFNEIYKKLIEEKEKSKPVS